MLSHIPIDLKKVKQENVGREQVEELEKAKEEVEELTG